MSILRGLPDRLRQLRASRRKSQKDMATLVGGSQRAWADYEGGRTAPGAAVLAALAAQGVNVHWLLLGEGAMRRTSSPGLDEDLLAAVIDGVRHELAAREATIDSGKYALLIKEVYVEARERLEQAGEAEAVRSDLIARFVRLAS